MAAKTSNYALSKKFISYGHYELTVTDKAGKTLSVIISDTDLIYRLSSELEKERAQAIEEAIAYVLANA